jgi:hypothetical protein
LAEQEYKVASCVEAIAECGIPSRTFRMKGGELPFLIQDYLARKLVTKADLDAIARKVSGQAPKLTLSALVTRTLTECKERQAREQATAEALRSGLQLGASATSSDEDMSLGASEASNGSDLSLGASEASSQGGAGASGQGGAGGRVAVDLQDKLFGSSHERRTSVRQLISQPEKAHFWNDLELGYLEGDDFVLYEVVSNKVSGGRALWQVRRRGTARKKWPVSLG